jgi:diguanylate cyclase
MESMSTSRQRATQRTLQGLLLKRFGMAVASYALTALLCWVGVLVGLFQAPTQTAVLLTLGVAFSQLVFLLLFLSHYNLRFSDPSLT